MAEEKQTEAKWQRKATVKLNGLTPDQVWPLVSDFCALDKWVASLDTCRHVDGVPGQLGLVRYCASTAQPTSNGGDGPTIIWAKEKLVAIDPIGRSLSYEVIDNNMGIKSYVGTMKVLATDGSDAGGGCQIEWSFVADPIQGWSLEDFAAYINSALQSMGKRMEEALRS
ncbi:lachrymatory-factor synthase-like [Malania oleifera]|uniref:lachrymatory-factor synthase-like n=1 Tax=Malania oleifera TaxID=397392 RepID=UPI0025AE415D|nr:lachrymatory-factor synthase-like [Malania oleifera]